MKKTTLLLIAFLFFQISFSANDRDEVLTKARTYSENKDYRNAIKTYIKYIKLFSNEAVNLKDIYYEVANCYFLHGKKDMAIKVIRETIYRYGATKEDLENSTVLNKETYQVVWSDIYPDYNFLRKKYINRVGDVDQYVENNIVTPSEKK
ncbi:Protein of unknown function precursor [Flavobacterium indicum GPTSA100-9 = DSM 17447]|uniref:Tetratricopeptide repeat protein n=1 Tax=Flavobacterium indicum (strain DSM 17447 / CIP 109464 / GPTSA100-9) TaxID=1094466 RepID=H8XQJ1_FLAIG|nr:tetratricopeptide repeat protein [Flavobacterium indicum]CCG52485.1 Protein of unknown function precursor [Flavobacterium indicum GPTSA100-9 = DSM 17447]